MYTITHRRTLNNTFSNHQNRTEHLHFRSGMVWYSAGKYARAIIAAIYSTSTPVKKIIKKYELIIANQRVFPRFTPKVGRIAPISRGDLFLLVRNGARVDRGGGDDDDATAVFFVHASRRTRSLMPAMQSVFMFTFRTEFFPM